MKKQKLWLILTVLFLAPLLRIVQFSILSREGLTYSVHFADYIIVSVGVLSSIYLTFRFNERLSELMAMRIFVVFIWIFLFGLFTFLTSFSFELTRALIIENYLLAFAFMFSVFYNFLFSSKSNINEDR